eukprot:TRINITY_DN5659_c0_g1_i1.p1 TRINITY_DN5659_c0_g1~~TRINITY_DN5659_c0_g1_i1.p1  ORF type:complete len:466 (+),score=98.01 TRINITY_DN5659_c0_g1_i1:59-1456(+)
MVASPRKRVLKPMPLLDEELVYQHTREAGIADLHVQKMWRYIVARGVTNIHDIPELPKALCKLVDDKFTLTTSRLVKEETSADNSTTKLLIELQDGARIETVIMRYGRFELKNFPQELQQKTHDGETKFHSKERATVCVSSQVGCQMGCTFCATGTMGLMSNLTAGEILEQLYFANKVERIRNVVFMGMGEPLDNYQAVKMAVKGMTDVKRFSLSAAKVAISTVGVVPRMLDMPRDMPDVGLAVSLHAPTQALREQIVPTGKAWHIDRIVAAMDEFVAHRMSRKARRNHILVEYVLIDDVNSSETVAHELGQLLQGRDVLLNVIPYNPTDVPHDYKPPSRAVTDRFNEIVRSYDIKTTIRQELGQDVNAACGQLVVQTAKAEAAKMAQDGGKPRDLEDLVKRPTDTNSSTVRRRKPQSGAAEPRGTTTATAVRDSNSNRVVIVASVTLMALLVLVLRYFARSETV